MKYELAFLSWQTLAIQVFTKVRCHLFGLYYCVGEEPVLLAELAPFKWNGSDEPGVCTNIIAL